MISEILKTNKEKTCFWTRVTNGFYQLGDINVERLWNEREHEYYWHVIVENKSFISWPYLKNAKLTAHKLDELVNFG